MPTNVRDHRRLPLIVALVALVALLSVAAPLASADLHARPLPAPAFDTAEVRAELARLPVPERPEVDEDWAWLAATAASKDADWLDAIEEVPRRERPREAPAGGAARGFADAFPAHEAAGQRADDPASFHWAVVVGVNRYRGVGDTLGSVRDAEVLRDELLARGWREDHVLVLTDEQATGERIIAALDWLARKTDGRSTVVFSMSGHIRHRGGVSALWPHDSRYIWADELGRLLAPIEARQMWVSFQGCHAAGLSAPGVERDGRVITYSSHVREKSYEDPETGQSLQGFYLFSEGIRDGWGDRAETGDGDGRVSVQEAFAWGAPRAAIRSAEQQHPVIVDHLGGPLHLEVTRR